MRGNDIKESYTQYKRNLNDIYRPVFEQVETYVFAQNIDVKTREDRMGELLDIFLNAQAEGKPVNSIVGNDIDRFCKNFCSDFTLKNRIAFILEGLKYAIWTPAALVILNIYFWITDGEAKANNYNFFRCMSLGNTLIYLIIFLSIITLFLITNVVMRHIMFKTKRLSLKAVTVVFLVEAVILLVVSLKFHLFEISISIPTWIIVLILIIYYVLYYFLCGRYNRRVKIKPSGNEK